MRCRDANDQLSVQRASHPAEPAEKEIAEQGHRCSPNRVNRKNEQAGQLLVTPPSRMYPPISTERIMRAVEQQKRITQQFDDLCMHQRQRGVLLCRVGMRLIAVVSFSLCILSLAFIMLSVFQPDLPVQLLARLSDAFATPAALIEGINVFFALIPANNWLFSGVALGIVLMTGLWLRLMRYPQEVS